DQIVGGEHVLAHHTPGPFGLAVAARADGQIEGRGGAGAIPARNLAQFDRTSVFDRHHSSSGWNYSYTSSHGSRHRGLTCRKAKKSPGQPIDFAGQSSQKGAMSEISTRDAARDSARDAVRDNARDNAMSVAAISSERSESDDNVWTRRLVLFLRV